MMNRLLFEAKGRYILELDGDDWLAPDAIELLSDALDQNPDGRMATGGMDAGNEPGSSVPMEKKR